MKKSIFRMSAWAAALLMAAVTTGCVMESDEAIEAGSDDDGTLIINITPTQVGSTRTVTQMTTDQSSNELMVQNMVVGVFKADATNNDGAVVTIKEYTVNASASSGISRLTNIENSTTHFAVGDEVLVALNVPASVVTKLTNTTNITTRKKFIGVFDGTSGYGISIDQALTQKDDYTTPTDNSIQSSYLPMFGEATITQAKRSDGTNDMSNSYKADISVIHMVSKITLNSIKFDRTHVNTAAAGDNLEVKEVFLINVPTMLDFNFSSMTTTVGTAFTNGYTFAQQDANIYQGWTDNYSADATNLDTDNDNTLDTDKEYRDYLGTGALSLSAITTGNSVSDSYTLYTMPNNNTTGVTKLVIKAALNATDYYYPIELRNNEGGIISNDNKVYPNRNYIVDVIIKGTGANTPYAELGIEQITTANINVQSWTDVSNTTTFNHDGGIPNVQ